MGIGVILHGTVKQLSLKGGFLPRQAGFWGSAVLQALHLVNKDQAISDEFHRRLVRQIFLLLN